MIGGGGAPAGVYGGSVPPIADDGSGVTPELPEPGPDAEPQPQR
jgi:hypothetical protein